MPRKKRATTPKINVGGHVEAGDAEDPDQWNMEGLTMPQRIQFVKPPRANHQIRRRDNGPNAHQRGYCSPQHKAWRLAVLERDNWQCRDCGRVCAKRREAHADHIIAVVKRPDLRYDVSNGQCLCSSCHSRKTVQEMHEG